MCGILFPPCTGLSGFADLNKIKNPVGWWKTAAISVKLGYLAGMVATKHLKEKRHFHLRKSCGIDVISVATMAEVGIKPTGSPHCHASVCGRFDRS